MDSITNHSPAGTSSKTLLHLLQLVKSGKPSITYPMVYTLHTVLGGFHGFDWGSRRANKKHHGDQDPPTYNLNDVEYPVAVYYGDNDLLADKTDVKKTIFELPFIVSSPNIMIHEVDNENWNHMDFVWGMDAKTFVYQDLIQNLKWCGIAEC